MSWASEAANLFNEATGREGKRRTLYRTLPLSHNLRLAVARL